ncbi:MAG TPA: DUF2279 domain-containing protein [Flavobacteriales bacterium]|nr:DUF2279 domain-containing protein [Flavobacteriales bacterium]HCA83380.1 DUF2279 domain-containing protein [Flavobacteriales bacterium]HRE74051.1 DUF2279 domain-containing protein [Flavobacteriales bacterium]HRE95914.1 DUF2279 domain-containing protein [Flavobacteriales bacterium]HRJ34425.1 DUF2279 domain-containing protein [Flavobacteriales bacterium]
MLWWVNFGNRHLVPAAIAAVILIFSSTVSFGTPAVYSAIEEPDADSLSINKKRLRTVLIAEGVSYASTMTALYFVWYKDQPLVKLHSFDDADEWLQMDKAGHFVTGYLIASYSDRFYRYANMSPKKAALIGSAQSLFFLSSLEMFDGISRDWGFSWSDMGANVLGCGSYLLQEYLWREQRIIPKFSAHTTHLAAYRPELLGSTFPSRILKDYNGQTYWLSFNLASTFGLQKSNLPKWLNIAFGYGANGLLGGTINPERNKAGELLPHKERTRQYYFSLDIDCSRIPAKKKWQKVVLRSLNWIKIPFPTLVLEQGKFELLPFYF